MPGKAHYTKKFVDQGQTIRDDVTIGHVM